MTSAPQGRATKFASLVLFSDHKNVPRYVMTLNTQGGGLKGLSRPNIKESGAKVGGGGGPSFLNATKHAGKAINMFPGAQVYLKGATLQREKEAFSPKRFELNA